MKKKILGAALAVALVVPAAARAQIAWDSPLLLPPNPSGEFGIYLVDVHEGGVGVLGTWRSSGWNFGLRGGIAERQGSGVGIFGGVDYNGTVNRSTSDFPIDIDWVLGAGLGVGDGVRLSVPLGLTAGHRFTGDGASFTPYLTPRVVLDGFFDSPVDGRNGMDLDFAVDLGLDLVLGASTSSRMSGLTIRFGGTIGDREGIALGIVF